jgi:hypothetical protein
MINLVSYTKGGAYIDGDGNRMLRRISGTKNEEEVGDKMRLHNEELHNLYASPNVIKEFKSRRRWAGHAARTEMREWLENLNGKGRSEDLDVDGRIILG